MKFKRTSGAAAALLILAAAAWPQAARAGTLADAMVAAVRNSAEMDEARAFVKVLAERAIQARAAGRLQVEGSLDLSAEFLELEEASYPTTMQLTVVQPLYTGGQVANATEAAKTRMTAHEARVVAAEQQTLLDAVTAYTNVRRDHTLVDLSENNVRVIAEQLRAARERFDVGEVTRTDVAQAQARLAAARSTLAARVGSLKSSIANFYRVIGVYPEDLQPPPPLPDLPDTPEKATAIAMAEDPELRAARLERKAAGSDVRAAIGKLLPQISLVGQLSRLDAMDINNDDLTRASVGLQVTIPFYSGGARYSAVREAQAAVDVEEANIIQTTRSTVEQVATGWADLAVAKASIEAGELEVRAARIAFEGVKAEATVGARTTLDVLNAEQELLSARSDLIIAQRNLTVAAYTLLFSIGKLTVEHLGLDLGDIKPVEDYWASVKDRNFGYDATDDTVWALSYRP